jgi:hypothetical protein
MKPVIILLCIIALPVIAPLALGMFVALSAILAFIVSAPFTLLGRAWRANGKPISHDSRRRRFALEAIYGAHRYERLRRYWFLN